MARRTRSIRLGLSIANLGYHYAAWRHPDVPAGGNMRFDHFRHCARLAEAGRFDLIFIADSAAVRDLDNPAIARELEHQLVKHEPLALLAAFSTVTTHVGLVCTASTTYTEPYNLTRMLATLDQLSGGRAGWNMVTGFSVDEARDFGLDRVLPSDLRHERVAEFVEVIRGLLDSWDDDALPRDKRSGVFFGQARMHPLRHKGRHFSVRGPLDVAPSPQRHIPVFTAGDSENAQELAARQADVVYGGQPDLASARAYYVSLKGRLAKHGRAPGALPVRGRTEEAGRWSP